MQHRRTYGRRFVAAAVALSVLAIAVPAAPVEAAQGIAAIDPLQTATRIGSLSTRTTIGALTPQVLTGSLVPDNLVKPNLAPIPYRPFTNTELVGIRSGAISVGPSTSIAHKPIVAPTTLSDTQLAELNAVEKDLNSRGQSLRTSKTFNLGIEKGGSQAELAASEKVVKGTASSGPPLALSGKVVPVTVMRSLIPKASDVDGGVLDTSSPTPAATAKPKATPTPTPKPTGTPEPPPNTLPYGYKSEGRKAIDPLPQSVDSVDYGQNLISKEYGKSYGSKFPASVDYFASVSAGQTHAGVQSVDGNVNADGYFFGVGGQIVNISAKVDTDVKNAQNSSFSLDIEAASQSIFNVKEPLPYSYSFEQSGQVFNINVPVQLGPFVIDIGASLTGEISADILVDGGSSVTQYGFPTSATVTPGFRLAGTFSASLGVGIADIASLSAGISGNIMLANVTLPITASIGFSLVTFTSGTANLAHNIYGCRVHFGYAIGAQVNYTFLQGNLSVNVTGCVVIFCDTVFSTQIAQWSGINGNKSIFNEKQSTAVGPEYTDLQEYGYEPKSSDTVFSKDDNSGIPKACHKFYETIGDQIPPV